MDYTNDSRRTGDDHAKMDPGRKPNFFGPGIIATEDDLLPEDLALEEIDIVHDLQEVAWSGLAAVLNAELDEELKHFRNDASAEDIVFLTKAITIWRRQWEGDVIQPCSFAASALFTAGLREMDDAVSKRSRRHRALLMASARIRHSQQADAAAEPIA